MAYIFGHPVCCTL